MMNEYKEELCFYHNSLNVFVYNKALNELKKLSKGKA